jgi:hypothetical protein
VGGAAENNGILGAGVADAVGDGASGVFVDVAVSVLVGPGVEVPVGVGVVEGVNVLVGVKVFVA